jgi:uncharacterized protein YjbI with pentapeptide repeats
VTSRFTGCSFARADLRGGNSDGWNDGLQDRPLRAAVSRFEDCIFSRTRTGQYGTFGRAVFERCTFTDTDFPEPVWFRGANLIDCSFRGQFRTVCFGWTGPIHEPLPVLDRVDVREARFESLEVYGVRGSGLITAEGQEVYRPAP